MDNNTKWVNEAKINRTLEALRKNNMKSFLIAMLYGPDKVIVIAGVNKIVKDINEAVYRVENFAAPANAKRLDKKTPCTVTGKCINCSSPERICREYTVIRKPVPNRIFILLLNENYGY